MRHDGRLSRTLHILLHMARMDGPVTSEAIAAMLHTNPAVVRRTMGGLREAGYVASEKGHGGGWTISCDLSQVTLLDIYTALDKPAIFAIGVSIEHPNCLAEQVVNRALEDAMREAEALLVARLGNVTLAQLAADFDRSMPAGWNGRFDGIGEQEHHRHG